MKSKIVSYTLETLPELSRKDLRRLQILVDTPDDQVNTCDIPDVTQEQAKTAVRANQNGRLVHPGSRKSQAA